jgi:lipopolysaccharide transport system ATP-binding protein
VGKSVNDIAIQVNNVGKCYQIYDSPRDRLKQFVAPRMQQLIRQTPKQYFHEFWALKDVSFEVKKGECLGIIGRNGCGKSTLLQIIAGTLAPTVGSVQVIGKIAALLELGSGFNPEFTGRENVYMNGAIIGLSGAEMDRKFDAIAAFADIGEFIEQPVKTYSSGMLIRLAFAVQANVDASIVLIDEALAVGDVFFRQKCYARLEQLRNSGAAIVLVSHSMPDVEQYCERAILLDHGKQRFIGAATEATKHYYLLYQAQPIATAVPNRIADSNESLSAESSSSIPRPPADAPLVDRPPSEAFIDLSNAPQVSNGQARCIGVALCDEAGQPCNSFRQGDVAVFYCEFQLTEDIGVPVFGVVITNDRGIIVHGKNAWQYDNDDVPLGLGAGSRVICRQEIALQLGLGEYTFELGLAAVTQSEWEKRRFMSHENWQSRYLTVCVVTNAGQFSVGFAMKNGVPVLTHHGVADLPGKILTKVVK